MSIRVVFLNLNRATPPTLPVAFDHILPYLITEGFKIKIIDLNLVSEKEAFFQIKKFLPHIVLVTIRNVDTAIYGQKFFLKDFKPFLQRIKSFNPDTVLIGGGIGFSIFPEILMDYYGLDYGVVGDGEETVVDLINSIVNGEDYSKINGIVFRIDEKIVVNKPFFKPIKNFFKPRRVQSWYRAYLKAGYDIGGGIETKRGCNRSCIYCVEPVIKGQKIRFKEPLQVVFEIREFLKIGINSFMFLDSEFNNPLPHAIEVLEAIIRNGLEGKIQLRAYLQPKPFSLEFAKLAKRAGFFRVDIDAVSFDDEQLKNMGVAYTTSDIVKATIFCKKAGLPFNLNYLLGGPNDTKEKALKTLDTLHDLNPASLTGTLGLRIYPGTPLSEIVEKQGGILNNPNIKGYIKNNNDFFKPVFYIERELKKFLKKGKPWIIE